MLDKYDGKFEDIDGVDEHGEIIEAEEAELGAALDALDSYHAGHAGLLKGYLEYGWYTIVSRALMDIDGFKPVHRRLLWRMYETKTTSLTKSATIVGDALKLHPHGDAAVYGAFVRLTDSSESQNVPFVKGKGSFGKYHTPKAYASPRYTEARLNDVSELLFGESAGMQTKPSYDGKYTEAVLLPTAIPNILMNGSTGIAVGISSFFPMFNFGEVIDYTTAVLDGETPKYLVPDFPSAGGVFVSEEDKKSIDETGRGKFELSGKYHIEGKTIVITEIPYYTTAEALVSKIVTIEGISDVRDEIDRHGFRIAVDVKRGFSVEAIVKEIFALTPFFSRETARMYLLVNGEPKILGVRGVVEEWIRFREGVLSRQYAYELEAVKSKHRQYSLLRALLSDTVRLAGFIDKIKISNKDAKDYLKSGFDADEASSEWVVGLKISTFYRVKDHSATIEDLEIRMSAIERILSDLRAFISKELKEIKAKYGSRFPRKTTILDYSNAVSVDSLNRVEKVDNTEYAIEFDGKYVKRVPAVASNSTVRGVESKIVAVITSDNRMLRLEIGSIPLRQSVYLPTHLGVEDFERIVAKRVLGVGSVAYLHSDGLVTTVDYSEWDSASKVRRELHAAVSEADSIGWAFNLPSWLMASPSVEDVVGRDLYVVCISSANRVGYFSLNSYKRKMRTGRTRVIKCRDGESVKFAKLIKREDFEWYNFPERLCGAFGNIKASDNFKTDDFNEWVVK